jgi:predicted transcriptional regulator of viral defense system
MKSYIEAFHNRKIFRFRDIVSIAGNRNTAKDLLHNYKKQKLICQIRRDLYAVTDLVTKECAVTKFEIGSNITPTSFISYHAALEYHGVAHQVFYDLHVSSESRFNSFEFNGINYLYCQSKVKPGIYVPNLDSLVRVTDLERTVIDCIDRIDRAGGLEELIHSISLIAYLNEDKLKLYLEEYDKAFLYQKAGFILSYFKQQVKISSDFISYCRQNTGKSIRYLTTAAESPVFFRNWALCAPENILSFLEQGGNEIV